jgi:HemY protein
MQLLNESLNGKTAPEPTGMKLNPQSSQGWIGTARAAMAASLWGEARAFLQRAEVIERSPALYKLYAELEDRTDGDRHAMRDWLLKASGAPPTKVWFCKQSGRVYPSWSPVAEPHGSFNTIVWDYPANTGSALQRKEMAEALIEAPAA